MASGKYLIVYHRCNILIQMFFQDENLDLSFLQHIREVTGYVLISHVDVRRIILPSLQIIRGRTLFKLTVQEDEFALLVTLSKMHNLEMPALRGRIRFSSILSTFSSCQCLWIFKMKSVKNTEIISQSPVNQHFILHLNKRFLPWKVSLFSAQSLQWCWTCNTGLSKQQFYWSNFQFGETLMDWLPPC